MMYNGNGQRRLVLAIQLYLTMMIPKVDLPTLVQGFDGRQWDNNYIVYTRASSWVILFRVWERLMYHNPLPGSEHIISTQFSRPKFVAGAWTTALALLAAK